MNSIAEKSFLSGARSNSLGTRLVRVWDMPHKHTFRIQTVKCLLRRFVGNGRGWADPFANDHSPAEHTNDLNPETAAKSHLDAVEFLNGFAAESLNGVLLDPPYSMHQCTVSYKGYGHGRVNSLTPVYDEIARIVKPGGYVMTFGWNSNGIGGGRGFGMCEVVMIPHGGHHNDTIVTVEVKHMESALLELDRISDNVADRAESAEHDERATTTLGTAEPGHNVGDQV